MSRYGESEYAGEKNYLYSELQNFVKNHPLSELIGMVSELAEDIEWELKHVDEIINNE